MTKTTTTGTCAYSAEVARSERSRKSRKFVNGAACSMVATDLCKIRVMVSSTIGSIILIWPLETEVVTYRQVRKLASGMAVNHLIVGSSPTLSVNLFFGCSRYKYLNVQQKTR